MPEGVLAPPASPEITGRRPYSGFVAVLAAVLAAYLLFDRAAAYLHIPGTPIYLGEAALLVGIVAFARNRAYVWEAVRGDALLCAAMAFFLWGVLRGLPNVHRYGLLWALRDSALWYYSLFAALVAAAALAMPELPWRLATKLSRLVPWLALWLPVAVLLSPSGVSGTGSQSRVHVSVPFTTVSIVSHKDGNVAVAALIGLLALWLLPDPRRSIAGRRTWSFLLIGTVLFAGTQNRGGLVAVLVAGVLTMVLTRGLARQVLAGVVAVTLAFIGLTFWFPNLSGHTTRSVTPSQLTNNLASLVGLDKQITLQGSVTDRKIQWSYVINEENREGKMAFGWGPGPNLGFGNATGIGDASLRSAHNSHLDVLARLGVVGLGLWILLWIAWLWRMLLGHFRLQRAGLHDRRRMADLCLVAALAILVNAFFDPSLESAQAAVPLWTLFGIGAVLTNPRWRLSAEPALEPSGRLTAGLHEGD